jgi:hypothetical protein
VKKRFLGACVIAVAGALAALALAGYQLALVTLFCGFAGYVAGELTSGDSSRRLAVALVILSLATQAARLLRAAGLFAG